MAEYEEREFSDYREEIDVSADDNSDDYPCEDEAEVAGQLCDDDPKADDEAGEEDEYFDDYFDYKDKEDDENEDGLRSNPDPYLGFLYNSLGFIRGLGIKVGSDDEINFATSYGDFSASFSIRCKKV